jgi:hypothetical protein
MSSSSVSLIKLWSLMLLSVTTGCSMWSKSTPATSLKDWSPTKWFKKEYQEPASVAAIWSPDTLAIVDQPTSRGFGGRIYFYNERSQAIPVEGDLLVHGYLTTPGRDKNLNVKADKKFAFTAEQLSSHFSPSEIGASYSIWIPWDEADGFREEVTLIPTFKSKTGQVVQGAPAKLFLPGRSRDKQEGPSSPMQTVSYVSNTIPTHSGNGSIAKTSPMRTTTIDIPSESKLTRGTMASYELGALAGRQTAANALLLRGGPNASSESASQSQGLSPDPSQKHDLRSLVPPQIP